MRKLCFWSCLFLSAGALSATTMNYSLTSGEDVITFSLSQQPVPLSSCAFSTDCFSVTPTDLMVDDSPILDGTVSFYTPASNGGITILEGDTLLMNNDGPDHLQLFSGSLSAPVLTAFSDLQLVQEPIGSPSLNEAFVLTANAVSTPTPEPGGLALLGFGILATGALLRRRNS